MSERPLHEDFTTYESRQHSGGNHIYGIDAEGNARHTSADAMLQARGYNLYDLNLKFVILALSEAGSYDQWVSNVESAAGSTTDAVTADDLAYGALMKSIDFEQKYDDPALSTSELEAKSKLREEARINMREKTGIGISDEERARRDQLQAERTESADRTEQTSTQSADATTHEAGAESAHDTPNPSVEGSPDSSEANEQLTEVEADRREALAEARDLYKEVSTEFRDLLNTVTGQEGATAEQLQEIQRLFKEVNQNGMVADLLENPGPFGAEHKASALRERIANLRVAMQAGLTPAEVLGREPTEEEQEALDLTVDGTDPDAAVENNDTATEDTAGNETGNNDQERDQNQELSPEAQLNLLHEGRDNLIEFMQNLPNTEQSRAIIREQGRRMLRDAKNLRAAGHLTAEQADALFPQDFVEAWGRACTPESQQRQDGVNRMEAEEQRLLDAEQQGNGTGQQNGRNGEPPFDAAEYGRQLQDNHTRSGAWTDVNNQRHTSALAVGPDEQAPGNSTGGNTPGQNGAGDNMPNSPTDDPIRREVEHYWRDGHNPNDNPVGHTRPPAPNVQPNPLYTAPEQGRGNERRRGGRLRGWLLGAGILGTGLAVGAAAENQFDVIPNEFRISTDDISPDRFIGNDGGNEQEERSEEDAWAAGKHPWNAIVNTLQEHGIDNTGEEEAMQILDRYADDLREQGYAVTFNDQPGNGDRNVVMTVSKDGKTYHDNDIIELLNIDNLDNHWSAVTQQGTQ